ncbi:MAG: hypothetical protein O7A98_05985, partial [Acidobacteria bacterium]|nr:hypothetical protein [Acidobacteriota bacterium]
RIRSETGRPFKNLDWSGAVRQEWSLFAGRVEVDGLSPGRWLLSVSTSDGRSWEGSVRLVAGNNDEVVLD